jgi:hypothetical protein
MMTNLALQQVVYATSTALVARFPFLHPKGEIPVLKYWSLLGRSNS